MKSWKIHLGWGLVVFVLSAALIRALSTGPQSEIRGPDKELRDEVAKKASIISDLKQELARANTQTDGSPIANSEESDDTAASGRTDELVARPVEERRRGPSERLSGDEALTAEEIRKLIRSGDRGDRWRALRAIGSIEDRTEKVSLLRELLASGDHGMQMLRRGPSFRGTRSPR